jgi:hypothetical protein
MKIAASDVSLSSNYSRRKVSASKIEDGIRKDVFTLQGLQDATKGFQGSKECSNTKSGRDAFRKDSNHPESESKSNEQEDGTSDSSKLLFYDVRGRRFFDDYEEENKEDGVKVDSKTAKETETAPTETNPKTTSKTSGVIEPERSPLEILLDIRVKLLHALFRMLSEGYPELFDTSLADVTSMEGGMLATKTVTHTEETYVSEYESSTISAKGLAVTEDGREIEFGVAFQMSRSFEEYTFSSTESSQLVLMDPLVINVSDDVQSISDQKFFFDLNADGEAEEISELKKGSGFLALDRNGDGVINDGTELFGAKTGDGFSELAEFDSDHNGWIDENDEVFSKLKVWAKNDDGTDELIDLKKADVGAIYLGSIANGFHANNSMNQTNAVYRTSGVFLHEECGKAGMISQVDLAIESA